MTSSNRGTGVQAETDAQNTDVDTISEFETQQESPKKTKRRFIKQPLGLPKNVQVVTSDPNAFSGPTSKISQRAVEEGLRYPELLSPAQYPKTASEISRLPSRFVVLGIETSCDDTAAAIVSSNGTVLGEAVTKQHELHENYGGVMPSVARDAHAAHIYLTINKALERAGLAFKDLNGIAVTMGPGLEICLRVGFHAARDLSKEHNLPFIPVHHLEAHCLVTKLRTPDQADMSKQDSNIEQTQEPVLVLLISGGHCQLILMKNVGSYHVLGGTVDDSIGEAYDKVARLLNLNVGGGGGPALEALAKEWASEQSENSPRLVFPVPMQNRPDCNMSYAGLKTAVRLAIEKQEYSKGEIAYAFQIAAVEHLIQRTKRALLWCENGNAALFTGGTTADSPTVSAVKRLVVCGGVASNQYVRQRLYDLAMSKKMQVSFPHVKYCTDNGVMVAWTAIERLNCMNEDFVFDNPDQLEVRARWPLGIYESRNGK